MGERDRAHDPFESLASDFPEIGPVLADGRRRYVLIDRLSSAGDDGVWLAEDRRHSDEDRTAFVTVRLFDALSAEARKRVGEAARRAFHARGRHIVRVLETGETPGGVYVVEEFVGATTLRDWLDARTEPLSRRDAALAAAAVAEGVQSVHSAGVVRCAPTLARVRVADDGTIKVACLAWDSLARPGGLRLGGEESATTGADVRDTARIALALLGAEDASAVHDATLRAIVARALGGEGVSADALARDLRRWLGHWPIEWRRPGALRQASLLARRSPVQASIVGVTLCALVVAVGALVWGYQRELERLDAQAHREAMRRTLAAQLPDIEQSIDDALSMLAVHWAIEWLAGPSMLDEPELASLAIQRRIETLSKIVERERERQGDSITTLLWESGKLFWLAVMGDWRSGEEAIVSHKRAWREIRPEDPWLDTLRLVHACFVVSRAADGDADADEISDALATLEGADSGQMAKPLDRLVRERLRQGAELLAMQPRPAQ